LSAGALSQIPLGELTALPRLPSWFRGWGSREKGRREGRGKVGSPRMPRSRVGKPKMATKMVVCGLVGLNV